MQQGQLKNAWHQPLPTPEVREGGESTWQIWYEASRQIEAAFAPTQPSNLAALSSRSPIERITLTQESDELSVDSLMLRARRNNRCCPQPAAWRKLYLLLAGDRHPDLSPPPLDHGGTWTLQSDLRKRLCFRDNLQWAEGHAQLPRVARFMDDLSESDWWHMGQS